jgi:riboflavin synthase
MKQRDSQQRQAKQNEFERYTENGHNEKRVVIDMRGTNGLSTALVATTILIGNRTWRVLASPRFIAILGEMFTGLIEEVGTVVTLRKHSRGRQLELSAPCVAGKVRPGDSVAVNGCCLTVTAVERDRLTFDILQESLDRTNLESLRENSPANLEPAVPAGAPLGGHFVQGHVDCAAPILELKESGADLRVVVELPAAFAAYVVSKGSIALNGISLTVAEVSRNCFAVWIIPHTRAHTNLATAVPGDLVNLEFDLLAKYVERILEHRGPASA